MFLKEILLEQMLAGVDFTPMNINATVIERTMLT